MERLHEAVRAAKAEEGARLPEESADTVEELRLGAVHVRAAEDRRLREDLSVKAHGEIKRKI